MPELDDITKNETLSQEAFAIKSTCGIGLKNLDNTEGLNKSGLEFPVFLQAEDAKYTMYCYLLAVESCC